MLKKPTIWWILTRYKIGQGWLLRRARWRDTFYTIRWWRFYRRLLKHDRKMYRKIFRKEPPETHTSAEFRDHVTHAVFGAGEKRRRGEQIGDPELEAVEFRRRRAEAEKQKSQ